MSALPAPLEVVELTMNELQSLLDRAKELGLPAKEYQNLEALVRSYQFLVQEIGDRDATIERLRQLVFGAKTESKANVKKRAGKAPPPTEGEAEDEKEPRAKRRGHGRIPAAAYTGTERVAVPLVGLEPGSVCPDCEKGKVYALSPRLIVRIQGTAPFRGTTYEQAGCRCQLCGKVFRAKMPEEVGEKKYDETVASMAAVLRYGHGLPMNRIEELQRSFGVPLPASTQWELMRDASVLMEDAFQELIRQAAQGEILFNDDTVMRILDYVNEENRRRGQGKAPRERTGTFTSGIVSKLSDGRKIVLYFTGHRHAGENLATVLAEREAARGPPIQMCDALSRNRPQEIQTILSNCLAHARRQFVDLVGSFPDEVDHVIEELARVYEVDARAKKLDLDADARLRLHQEESGPVMEDLEKWLEALLAEKRVEPNSSLGKAIAYMQKHWKALTLFLRVPGAPLDNSLTERMLKRSIIHRQDGEGRIGGRPLHVSDRHGEVGWCRALRLPHRAAAPRGGGESEPWGVDAVELPGGPRGRGDGDRACVGSRRNGRSGVGSRTDAGPAAGPGIRIRRCTRLPKAHHRWRMGVQTRPRSAPSAAKR